MHCTDQQPPQRDCLSWFKMAVGLTKGPDYPGHFPHTKHFFTVLRTTAEGQHSVSLESIDSFFLFFSYLALARILILLFALLKRERLF